MDAALTPLAIALQGIGYGSFLTAVQGLAALELPAQPPVITITSPFGRPKRRTSRARRVLRPVTPYVDLAVDDDAEDETALQLLGML